MDEAGRTAEDGYFHLLNHSMAQGSLDYTYPDFEGPASIPGKRKLSFSDETPAPKKPACQPAYLMPVVDGKPYLIEEFERLMDDMGSNLADEYLVEWVPIDVWHALSNARAPSFETSGPKVSAHESRITPDLTTESDSTSSDEDSNSIDTTCDLDGDSDSDSDDQSGKPLEEIPRGSREERGCRDLTDDGIDSDGTQSSDTTDQGDFEHRDRCRNDDLDVDMGGTAHVDEEYKQELPTTQEGAPSEGGW